MADLNLRDSNKVKLFLSAKQEREINDMRNNLQVGDEITTIGGIIGKIVSIKEETCIVTFLHGVVLAMLLQLQ